jgi:predicted Fe-Mo cluster-binding NifX family protein
VQAADLAAKLKQPTATSLDEARTAVSFTLREPSYLPAGLALVEVRVVGTSTVILNYGGTGGNVSVVQSNEDVGRDRVPPDGSQTAQVTVNGLPATLITGSDGTNSLLRWQDGGVRYVVAGPLAGTEALKVAEGLK